jgi:hypothetical protein
MASFENRVKDIDQKTAQDKRRLELVFTKLGDVLIEIASQPEIHSTDKKQLYPLPATKEIRQLQVTDTEGAVFVHSEPKLLPDTNTRHDINEMETRDGQGIS